MPINGTYCLCIENHVSQTIRIGALRDIYFQDGGYIYVGSALNSLIPRLERHQKTSKGTHHTTHWHIDYLLREPNVELISIYIIESDEKLECSIARRVDEHGEPIPRFGCSDCKCRSHLYKVNNFEFIEEIGLKKWV
jgi:Uri superfamily endonuclease